MRRIIRFYQYTTGRTQTTAYEDDIRMVWTDHTKPTEPTDIIYRNGFVEHLHKTKWEYINE